MLEIKIVDGADNKDKKNDDCENAVMQSTDVLNVSTKRHLPHVAELSCFSHVLLQSDTDWSRESVDFTIGLQLTKNVIKSRLYCMYVPCAEHVRLGSLAYSKRISTTLYVCNRQLLLMAAASRQ